MVDSLGYNKVMSKKLWIIFIILIVATGAFFIINGNDAKQSNNSKQSGNIFKISEDDHVAGSDENKIVVMEYFDFQCPGCAGLYPTMQQAKKEYGSEVTFVFRHLPLTNIHPNAIAAARAAEAASNQGKFFEMEAMLFTRQDEWKNLDTGQAQKKFESYAQQLNLDIEKFKDDYSSAATLDRINRDRDSAGELGATGTPSVFLNGEQINYRELEEKIKDAIDNKKYDTNQD